MKLFSYGKDGGPDSTVWGWWLIEAKSMFSIALLCFEDGSRDAYHSHAFTSVSWVLSGWLTEHFRGEPDYTRKTYRRSWTPIVTHRHTFHRVRSNGRTWVITFRGPWKNTWMEYAFGKFTTLTHGRRPI